MTPTVTKGLTTWVLTAITALTLAGAIAAGIAAGLEAGAADTDSTIVTMFTTISTVCTGVAAAVGGWLGKLRVSQSEQLVALAAEQPDWHHLAVTNTGSGGTVTVDGERVPPEPSTSVPLAEEGSSRLREAGEAARGRLAQRERVQLDPDDPDDPTPEAAADGSAWGASNG